MHRFKVSIFWLLVALLSLAGCATADSNKNGTTAAKPRLSSLQNAYIIGVSVDRSIRVKLEERLKELLNQVSVKSFHSYDDIEHLMYSSNEKIRRLAKERDLRNLVIIKAIGVERIYVDNVSRFVIYDYDRRGLERFDRPGYNTQINYSQWIENFNKSYQPVVQSVSPATYQAPRIEAYVFDIKSERLIWHSTFEILLKNNVDAMVEELSEALLIRLEEDGLI